MNYLKYFTISLMLVMAITFSLNRLVDPYGLFWAPIIDGINAKKPYSTNRSQVTKEHYITKIHPEIVFIGNSRIEMGFDDKHPLFKNTEVFNFASPGLPLNAQLARAYYVINNKESLSTIYLSLDFVDFLVWGSTAPPQTPRLITQENEQLLGFYLSLNTTVDSIKTLFGQNLVSNNINKNGTHLPNDYINTIKHEGLLQLYKQKLKQLTTMFSNPNIRIFDDNNFSPTFSMLRDFLKVAKGKNIKVNAFINPYQISYLHVINESGKLPLFFEWKKQVTGIFESSNIPLYDFSGINLYTMEPVNNSVKHKLPTYFWEPAHYTANMGNIIINDLNTHHDQLIAGRVLTSANINATVSSDTRELFKDSDNWHELKSLLGFDN